MNRKEILMQVMSDFFDFESALAQGTDYTMADFLGYLNTRHNDLHAPLRNLAGAEEKEMQEDRNTNTELSVLLIFMYRYSVFYGKKALKDSEITTLDEFSFLIILMTHTHLGKTELINKLIIEKTSGVEVIKRLLKQGLIKEYKNPNDKRSVLVAITEKGKQLVHHLLPKMHMVGDAVVGDLNGTEISALSYLLRRLDHFHHKIFTSRRNWELEELLPSASSNLTG